MIETATTARTQQAFDDAHAARGAAFVGFFRALFGVKFVPLAQPTLTEPSRCA
ncbi:MULTISPECIES: hypothetical protein [unclassified Shimia]|uniref:hypothetical protein n=1 Tax=unclassified Shimia TaxID=2630038 RepID=UPI00310849AC